MPSVPESLWHRPHTKRALNAAYLDALGWLQRVMDLLPWFVRNALWRVLLRECGHGTHFDLRVYVKFPWLVSLGSGVSVNRNVEFYPSLRARAGITIGARVRIGPHVRFHAAGHDPDDPDFADVGAPIVVGEDVWLGSGALVLPGVTIGRGAVIAAGSVVQADVPPGVVVAGVPARVVRERATVRSARP